jgi:glycosyltransferase involved in cell wall biosynthesis
MSNSKKPVISVIIPVFNAANSAPRAIDSILGQTMPDFELILVDDGSTDDSLAVCKDYARADQRVLVLQNDANEGAGSARNKGTETATGDYIVFVDADDYALPGMLKSLYAAVELHQADAVKSGRFIAEEPDLTSAWSQEGEVIAAFEKLTCFHYDAKCLSGRDFLRDLSLNVIDGFANSFLIRADICKKALFSNHRHMEDLLFCADIPDFAQKICLIPEHSYVYLLRKDNSRTKTIEFAICSAHVDMLLYDKLLKYNLDECLDHVYNRIYYYIDKISPYISSNMEPSLAQQLLSVSQFLQKELHRLNLELVADIGNKLTK